MQKARRHCLRSSDRLKAYGFRVSFIPLFGVLFTFPSRYWFAIGLSRVFSLGGWARRIRAGLLVSRATQGAAGLQERYAYGPFTLCGAAVRLLPLRSILPCRGPTTPQRPGPPRFGLLPGRSPLLGESLLFSLPAGTKMFQFPAFASRFCGMTGRSPPGFPIRTPPCQRPCAPRRGFSQLVTSFVACESLGIHRTPFFTPSSGLPQIKPRRRRAPGQTPGVTATRLLESYLLHCNPHGDSLPGRDAPVSFVSCLRVQYVIDLFATASSFTWAANVENNGFEPLTPCLQSRCSSQLS